MSSSARAAADVAAGGRLRGASSKSIDRAGSRESSQAGPCEAEGAPGAGRLEFGNVVGANLMRRITEQR